MGAAYADLVWGEGNVGPATHLVSHANSAAVGDIVDALEQYCKEAKLSPDATYVWLCCLCLNQHRAREAPEADGGAAGGPQADGGAGALREQILRRMRRIGRVLAFVGPWGSPKHLTRTWCVAETYLALSLGSDACEVTSLLAPAESERLAREVRSGGGAAVAEAWAALAALDVEGTQTWRSQDKRLLLQALGGRPGLAAAGAAVARHMQTLLVAAAEGHARRLLASGRLDGDAA